MVEDFAVFILTHGRPDRVFTYDRLRKQGYTGKIYLVIDDEDKTEDKYREKYGNEVVMFEKSKIAKTFDNYDNFDDRRTIVYARNACFNIAKEVGVTYFLQLDDDYTGFEFKFNERLVFKYSLIKNLDNVFAIILDFYKKTSARSVAMAQGGDFIGGANGGGKSVKLSRKCMNTFFCSTDRPFKFLGRINEDVNTYVGLGSKGSLFLTFNQTSIVQKQTQANKGGMTDVYMISGTYLKSFYTVMANPSSVCVAEMGEKHKRLHHRVRWSCAVPVILSERYKKK